MAKSTGEQLFNFGFGQWLYSVQEDNDLCHPKTYHIPPATQRVHTELSEIKI